MNARAAIAVGLVVALAGTPVRAQFGFPVGMFGWGGWSSTVQGDIAHGMGALAAGAGAYNQSTAVANSINADTVMRINQYMFQAQQEANQRQFARNARRVGRTTATLNDNAARLRNSPDQSDIDRGDALNVLLDDLTAPVLLHSSSLRLAGSDIDSGIVRAIPFRNASEAVTICIEQLTDKQRFPSFLRSDALPAERDAFLAAVHEAARQAREQGEISSDALAAVQTAGKALYARASSPEIKALPAERNEALNYLKGMAALARMVVNPETLQALRDLKKIETTHISNLIAFMHSYNFRFGPATEPDQRAAYRSLYPILKADRDRIYATLGPQATQPPPPTDPKVNPTEVFQGLEPRQLDLPAVNP